MSDHTAIIYLLLANAVMLSGLLWLNGKIKQAEDRIALAEKITRSRIKQCERLDAEIRQMNFKIAVLEDEVSVKPQEFDEAA